MNSIGNWSADCFADPFGEFSLLAGNPSEQVEHLLGAAKGHGPDFYRIGKKRSQHHVIHVIEQ
jgi:cbb3-type cytochrome oxidase cytochrome c subunit